MGFGLEVQTSKSTSSGIEGNAALREDRIQTVLLKFLLAPCTREKPPLVHMWLDFDLERPFQLRLNKSHSGVAFSFASGLGVSLHASEIAAETR